MVPWEYWLCSRLADGMDVEPHATRPFAHVPKLMNAQHTPLIPHLSFIRAGVAVNMLAFLSLNWLPWLFLTLHAIPGVRGEVYVSFLDFSLHLWSR